MCYFVHKNVACCKRSCNIFRKACYFYTLFMQIPASLYENSKEIYIMEASRVDYYGNGWYYISENNVEW